MPADRWDQLALLRHEPALLPTAVEEMLRYDSSTNKVARVTREPWATDDQCRLASCSIA